MPKRKLLLLIIATLVAVGIIIMTQRPKPNTGNPSSNVVQEDNKPSSEVLVAVTDIAAGTILAETMVQWQKMPAENVQKGWVVNGVTSRSSILGGVVRDGIKAGQPLSTERIVKAGERGFLAAVLAPGMRAMSVSVNSISGVAGFVFPGDRVDVILTHTLQRENDPGLQQRRISETVLQNLRVLALDQRTNFKVSDEKEDKNKTEAKVAEVVTLEVTSQQAEQLTLARELGTISLVLRSVAMPGSNLSDHMVTWDSDVSGALPAPIQSSEQNFTSVQIVRGRDVTPIYFGVTPTNRGAAP